MGHIPGVFVESMILRTRAVNYKTMNMDRESNQILCLRRPHRHGTQLEINQSLCVARSTNGTLSVRDHTVYRYRSGFQPGHVPCIVVEPSVLRTRAGNYQTMSTDREFNQSRCLVIPHRNVAHLASNRIVCLACSTIANFAM